MDLVKSINDFVEWGFGFEIDTTVKQISEEPHEVDTAKFNSNYRILQACRKALFALTCVAAIMLTERVIIKLFPDYIKRAGFLNRWIPTPLLCLVQVVSLIAWYQLKYFIQTNVHSVSVITMLHHPKRFAGALWEVFKKQSHQISVLDLLKIPTKNAEIPPVNDEEIKKLTTACTNLKQLNLKASGLSGLGLKSLTENCPHLKVLGLHQAKFNDQDYIQLSSFNSLNNLTIEDPGFSQEGMKSVAQLAPHLNFLSLNAPITKEDFAVLDSQSSAIHTLKIYSPHLKAIDMMGFCKKNVRNLSQVCCLEDETVELLQGVLNNDTYDGHWYRSSDEKGCKLYFEANPEPEDDDYWDDDDI